MPYDGKILSRAMARFDEDKQRRTQQFRERQQRLFCREPELADIDRRLRGTMSQIISRALRQGKDPVPAIHAIRDENLALQRRRGELLEAMGYPADYLEEKPRCARCGDAGFRSDGTMCPCLRSYYAREQIAELSHLLDIPAELVLHRPKRSAALSPGDGGAESGDLPPVCPGLPSRCTEPAAVRRPGPGQDLSVCLHCPGGQRGRLLRGV